ncbi:hypothetical protein [Natronomonas marina]|uniref:hypothetical protein n=1 Tax=Natronomonas marina TaxID=2961939 RepID=UPI0020C93FFB|nr:hypothetical protein [Natronomonas marina]
MPVGAITHRDPRGSTALVSGITLSVEDSRRFGAPSPEGVAVGGAVPRESVSESIAPQLAFL